MIRQSDKIRADAPWRVVILGHCYSKKNHRPIYRAGSGKPFVGKSKRLRQYEEYARDSLALVWSGGALEGGVAVRLAIYYAGQTPDALGPAETIFDCLERAGVVANDRQLVPWGNPAIERHRVERASERVEIELWPLES